MTSGPGKKKSGKLKNSVNQLIIYVEIVFGLTNIFNHVLNGYS